MEVAAIRRELDALKEVIAPLNQRIEELERRLDGAENVFVFLSGTSLSLA